MKRKMFICLLCMTTLFSLSACGKSEEEKEIEAVKEELGIEGESDFLNALAEEEAAFEAEKAAQEEAQEGYKVYDRAAELDSAENIFLAVQIDDKVYKVGQTVGEIVATIESSEIEYGYSEYNSYTPDKIVPAKQRDRFQVTRDGADWFYVEYYNPTEETISINDCICLCINNMFYSWQLSRMFGVEPDVWASMTYDDVDKLAEEGNIFSGFEVTKEDGTDVTEWQFKTLLITNEGGVEYARDYIAYVNVNMDTNSVSSVNYTAGIPEEYVKEVELTSFEGVPDEVFEEANKKAEEALAADYENYRDFELLKYLLLEVDSFGCKNSLVFVYKMTSEDGNVAYSSVELSNPVIVNDTTISNSLDNPYYDVGYKYNTLEEAEEGAMFLEDLLEEKIIE